jgi:hypothetical protein
MKLHFDGLIPRDQCRDGHNTAVARGKAGALPYVAEQAILG